MGDEPTPEQLSCGFALYGPPAICTCGTCLLCKYCKGAGTDLDYIGLEMKCVETECVACKGTGRPHGVDHG